MTGIIIAVVVTLLIAAPGGYFCRKKIAEAKIGSAEAEAKRIEDEAKRVEEETNRLAEEAKHLIEEAEREGENKKKEAVLAAKEEIMAQKNEAENEIKERRSEVTRLEHRVAQKEESYDKKLEALERKDETLQKKIKENEEKAARLEEIKVQQEQKLEEIAGLTAEEAKDQLVAQIDEEVRHEAAMRIVEIESQLKEEVDEKAKNLLALAIQRCASDHTAEITVSRVELPNDEMKGRIIGREGRNIRAIEQLTGCDLIIDDTPETITLSSFDPMRREIARLTLEKLMADGRIHQARIEETVAKSTKEVENAIKQAGERATFEVGVHGLAPELIRLLGKLKFRTSYGQNVLRHSIEVAQLSGLLADELGCDTMLARRAGLLHDIGKALSQENEGSHTQLGVELAKKYKENKDIIHAIEAHHDDVEPRTLIAMIVKTADAISAARPGARREDLQAYIQRLQKLEEIANSFEGVEKSFAIQAGREVRIMVKPETVNDEQMVFVAREIVKKIEQELQYPGQIKINVIRETRVSEVAK